MGQSGNDQILFTILPKIPYTATAGLLALDPPHATAGMLGIVYTLQPFASMNIRYKSVCSA